MNLFELTRELIDIPSVTGDEAGGGTLSVATISKSSAIALRDRRWRQDRFNVIATTEATAAHLCSRRTWTRCRRSSSRAKMRSLFMAAGRAMQRDHRRADLCSGAFAR